LHSEIEKLLNSIFVNNDPLLIKHLFEDAKIIPWIVGAFKDQHVVLHNKGIRVRKGYLGHLTRIANSMIQYSANNETISGYLKGNSSLNDAFTFLY